jgi:hypothetical protein
VGHIDVGRVILTLLVCINAQEILNQNVYNLFIVVLDYLEIAFLLSTHKRVLLFSNVGPYFNRLLLTVLICVVPKDLECKHLDGWDEGLAVLVKELNNFIDTLQSNHSDFRVILILTALEDLFHDDPSIASLEDSLSCRDELKNSIDTDLSHFIVNPCVREIVDKG